MRTSFHDDLDQLNRLISDLIRTAEKAIGSATEALLDADLAAAEAVISGDVAIDATCRRVEEIAVGLQLRQQPVAGDLRLLIAAQRIAADLERSGDLAKNIAKQARLRYPDPVVPAHLRDNVVELGAAARMLLHKAGVIFATRDPVIARELETDDDRVDDLHRALLHAVVASTGEGAVETAVGLTLCGRYYERVADHAVAIAHHVIYLSTGEHV